MGNISRKLLAALLSFRLFGNIHYEHYGARNLTVLHYGRGEKLIGASVQFGNAVPAQSRKGFLSRLLKSHTPIQRNIMNAQYILVVAVKYPARAVIYREHAPLFIQDHQSLAHIAGYGG